MFPQQDKYLIIIIKVVSFDIRDWCFEQLSLSMDVILILTPNYSISPTRQVFNYIKCAVHICHGPDGCFAWIMVTLKIKISEFGSIIQIVWMYTNQILSTVAAHPLLYKHN